MLDERLLNTNFQLTTDAKRGEVTLFGIRYHYVVVGEAHLGDWVTITAVSPLGLTVSRMQSQLTY